MAAESRRIADRDVEGAETVIYVLSRISGEGRERRWEEGDYYLKEREREDILFLNKKNIPIILVLNVGGPLELTDILEDFTIIKYCCQFLDKGVGSCV